MRLISFNISIKKDNTSKVIELLNSLKPDFIALQESMMPHEHTVFKQFRSGKDISDYFINCMPYSFFAPLFMAKCITKNGICVRNFGGQVEQGTQLLSNALIVSAENKFYYNNYKTKYDTTHFREKDWTRSVLCAVVELLNGRQIKIINVHGIWNATRMGDERTISQSEFIISEVLKDKMPTIVAGDFNLLPESPSIKIMEKHLTNLSATNGIKTTRPSFNDGLDKGNMIVDYIFVTDDIKVIDFNVLDTNISDHFPLVLDFDI